MQATLDGIHKLAYARWEHRGQVHGFDRQDWLAAERQERFQRNYRVVAVDRLDGDSPRAIGASSVRRCRFCSGSAPRAEFSELVSIYPAEFGLGSPVAFDQCDECASMFAEEIDAACLRFVRSIDVETPRGIPVAAFKGLVKLALAVMAPGDLDEHEETIDWIGNPDHDFDLSVLRDLACIIHRVESPFPASWAVLAQKTDDDVAWPSMIFFLGIHRTIFQLYVPLSRRDDDLELTSTLPPDILPPSPFGLGNDPTFQIVLPIASETRVKKTSINRLVA